MDRSVVTELATGWASTADLLEGLDDKDWERPTDCPGWTVKDQVSHMIGTESMLLRRPSPPAVDPETAPHAKSPSGLINEAWVAARRGNSPAQVRAEFREVTEERLQALQAMSDQELAAPTKSPVGEVPYAEFMNVRVMDCWVHEQDIRRAVGRPGALDGTTAQVSLGRFAGSLGYVVGKRAAAPEGTSVVVELQGPNAQTLAVTVSDGRARPTQPPPDQPTVRLEMSTETYACLSAGRWSSDEVLADGKVKMAGDNELGRSILRGMAIIP